MNPSFTKVVAVNVAALACFLLTYLIGLACKFDGQAAVLTIPFVVLGWVCAIYGIVIASMQVLRASENPKARIISGVFLLGYGLLSYFLIPKH